MVEAEEEASDEEAVLSSMLAQQRLAADEAMVCLADACMQAQVHRVAASQALTSRIVLGMLKVRSHVICASRKLWFTQSGRTLTQTCHHLARLTLPGYLPSSLL